MTLRYARHTFPIIWVKKPQTVAAPPLFESTTTIIERCLIGVKTSAVGHYNGDQLRGQIQDLSKLHFALPDLLFRLLCRGDVSHGTHIFELARARLQRASYNVEVLDRSVRHQQTMSKIKVC